MAEEPKRTYLQPNHIERKVGNETVKFWPVTGRTAFKMRRVGEPLTKVLSVLFQSRKTDVGRQSVQTPVFENGVLKGMSEQTTELACGADVLKFRGAQMDQAVSQLWAVGMSDEVLNMLCEFIIDSAREEFKGWTPQKFQDEVPITVIPALVAGVIDANKGVFGPLAQRLDGLKGQIEKAFHSKLGESLAKSAPIEATNPSETVGSTSPTSTPSSPSEGGISNTSSISTSSPSEPSATPPRELPRLVE